MAVSARVVYKRRATITDLPLYYSGHLLKKHTGDKDFKMFYGELRGAVLFLYENDTQDTYSERLDLDQMKSMQLDSPVQKTPAVFTFITSTKEVQLKMDNPDTGEAWRGYILTVAKKEIPKALRLLPGQIRELQEILAQEKRRTTSGPNPPLPPRPAFLTSPTNQGMPECFFSVSRQEAEQMLEKNPEFGSIILRPSSKTNNYGLTLRQLTSSGPILKNYRVTSIPNSGFIIELDSPVKVSSLNEVINYVLQKTDYRLQPYTLSKPYDTKLELKILPGYVNNCNHGDGSISKTYQKPETNPKQFWSILEATGMESKGAMLTTDTAAGSLEEKPQLPASTSTLASKVIPQAKVLPQVHWKKDVPVSAVKADDSNYLVPEEECKPKSEAFDGELRKKIQQRREFIYSSNNNETTYEVNP